ncbi:Small nucleolar ribonucleoprotein complex subunit [Mycena kentingensis (nom. inval.)]|nr:Small nucleolar ribonucleoprotein complex subunit [Mycena kentingensis (nom. inval.)]
MTHSLPNFNPYAHYLTPKVSASAPPTAVRTLPPRMTTPPPLPSHPANLSSPFNPMRPPTYFLPPRMNPGQIIPVHVDDIFTSSGPPSSSQPWRDGAYPTRITLFQETSDESFEESLKAGGYGRYRTAHWLGTQSPSSPATPAPPSASDVVKRVKALQATQPPREKSKKLRRRLNAFPVVLVYSFGGVLFSVDTQLFGSSASKTSSATPSASASGHGSSCSKDADVSSSLHVGNTIGIGCVVPTTGSNGAQTCSGSKKPLRGECFERHFVQGKLDSGLVFLRSSLELVARVVFRQLSSVIVLCPSSASRTSSSASSRSSSASASRSSSSVLSSGVSSSVRSSSIASSRSVSSVRTSSTVKSSSASSVRPSSSSVRVSSSPARSSSQSGTRPSKSSSATPSTSGSVSCNGQAIMCCDTLESPSNSHGKTCLNDAGISPSLNVGNNIGVGCQVVTTAADGSQSCNGSKKPLRCCKSLFGGAITIDCSAAPSRARLARPSSSGSTSSRSASSTKGSSSVRPSSESDDDEPQASTSTHKIANTRWGVHKRHYSNQAHTKVVCTTFHAPSNLLVVGFSTGVFGLWEMPAFSNVHTLSISQEKISSVAINASGEWLAFGAKKLGQLLVWEWQSESYILKQQGHFYDMNTLAYAPDGQTIATGGDDGKVKVWSTHSGFCFITFTEHTAPSSAVAFAKHGSVLFSASLDGTVRAYDLVRYRNFHTFTSPSPVQFSAIAVDPSGEVVAAGSTESLKVFMWSVQTGKLLDILTGHEGPISTLDFSPTGANQLASGSWDRTIRIWNVFGRSRAVEPLIASSDVLAVAFRPDGNELATSSLDGQIAFFDVDKGKQTNVIEGRKHVSGGRKADDRVSAANNSSSKSYNSLAYTADGECILAGGNSRHVVLIQISQNFSLDGTEEFLDSRKVNDAGINTDLIDSRGDESDLEDRMDLSLPGASRGAGIYRSGGTGKRRERNAYDSPRPDDCSAEYASVFRVLQKALVDFEQSILRLCEENSSTLAYLLDQQTAKQRMDVETIVV